MVFGILVAFGILGLVGSPNSGDPAVGLVDLAFIAVYFILFLLSLSHRLRHRAAVALAASAVLGQIAVALTAESPHATLGIVINLLYGIVIISALQVRFRVALLFATAMLVARAWTFTYRGMWKDETILLYIFMVVEFVFLTVGSYLSEVRDRKSFLFEQSLKEERARSHALVQNVLPPTIADEISRKPGTLARHHESVTVMFADIVAFTPFATEHPPEKVVGLLNDLFSRFDALTRESDVLKLKTVGDCYMVAGGLPEPLCDHVAQVANLALEFRGVANALGIGMRMGIHTGPVVAGVLGTERLMYDIWGPTVNLAARLEASAEAGQILVSGPVCQALSGTHQFQSMGKRDLKGVGPTDIFALQRRNIQSLDLQVDD